MTVKRKTVYAMMQPENQLPLISAFVVGNAGVDSESESGALEAIEKCEVKKSIGVGVCYLRDEGGTMKLSEDGGVARNLGLLLNALFVSCRPVSNPDTDRNGEDHTRISHHDQDNWNSGTPKTCHGCIDETTD
jgi:hypothetical protein